MSTAKNINTKVKTHLRQRIATNRDPITAPAASPTHEDMEHSNKQIIAQESESHPAQRTPAPDSDASTHPPPQPTPTAQNGLPSKLPRLEAAARAYAELYAQECYVVRLRGLQQRRKEEAEEMVRSLLSPTAASVVETRKSFSDEESFPSEEAKEDKHESIQDGPRETNNGDDEEQGEDEDEEKQDLWTTCTETGWLAYRWLFELSMLGAISLIFAISLDAAMMVRASSTYPAIPLSLGGLTYLFLDGRHDIRLRWYLWIRWNIGVPFRYRGRD
jgi:hypothetical protein